MKRSLDASGLTFPEVDPPTDPPDPAVARIIERASRISHEEAVALDAALRARPPADAEAQSALDAHQLWKNRWGMFYSWPDPYIEMAWVREHLYASLGLGADPHQALEPDDGTIAWGAATAAAYAVLVAGRAQAPWSLRAAWDAVIPEA